MLATTTAFRTAKDTAPPHRAILLSVITTNTARYIFSQEHPTDAEVGVSGVSLWDGSASVGDGSWFNPVPVADWESYVISFGSLPRGIAPVTKNVLAGFSQMRIPTVRVVYTNRTRYFSSLFSLEDNFSFQKKGTQEILVGFPGLGYNDFQRVFFGKNIEEELTPETFTLISEAA